MENIIFQTTGFIVFPGFSVNFQLAKPFCSPSESDCIPRAARVRHLLGRVRKLHIGWRWPEPPRSQRSNARVPLDFWEPLDLLVPNVWNEGMIHCLTINNNPSNPQQPIQQPYVKRTSKWKGTWTYHWHISLGDGSSKNGKKWFDPDLIDMGHFSSILFSFFLWNKPWNNPSSYWGDPHDGNPHIWWDRCTHAPSVERLSIDLQGKTHDSLAVFHHGPEKY